MRSRPLARGIAALLTVIAVLQFRPAAGSPGDIFTIPAPVIGADPPKATDIKAGDASVSTQTGAVQYSYPVSVPPGRNGMSPAVGISYSSQAPIYGGLAAGWTLTGLPTISEDLSRGRLRTRSAVVEAEQLARQVDPKADDRFISSMAGGRPLVPVTEPTGVVSDVYQGYRVQNDSTFARYERMKPQVEYRWRVRTTDGKLLTFGEATRMPGCPVSDHWAPLTGMTDAFGNEVRYDYTWMSWGECVITRISWGQNAAAAEPDFAHVLFTYKIGTACNGVYPGSQIDYRSGIKVVTGAGRIETIKAIAYVPGSPTTPLHTRTIDLTYDELAESCQQSHAPIRLLKSIKETAWGSDSPSASLPAITFDYNPATVSLVSPQNGGVPSPWPQPPLLEPNLGWGYRRTDARWPSVESMFVDLDGDGLQDLLVNTSGAAGSTGGCTAEWWKNNGTHPSPSRELKNFSWKGSITLPRLKWRGAASPHPAGGALQPDRGSPNWESCALNGQVTAFENSYINGTFCHWPGSTCTSGSDPSDLDLYCFPGGTYCPPDPGSASLGRPRTYLAYRWLDADADGLTDLVAAVHGDFDYYDIERGNLAGYDAGEPSMSGIPGLNQWPACPGAEAQRCKRFDTCLDDQTARNCDGGACQIDWLDVVACVQFVGTTGCSNVIAKPAAGPDNAPGARPERAPYMRCEGLYPWFIYKNQGQGEISSTPIVKYQPVPLESSSGDSSFGGPLVASENHTITDFDGDGWLDAVVRETDENAIGNYVWQVWLGDGTGGFGPRMYPFPTRDMNCPTGCPFDHGDNALSGIGGAWGQSGLSTAGLLDVNGDGAQDHWLGLPSPGNNANIAFNDGDQLRLFVFTAWPPTGEATTVGVTSFSVKPGNDVYVSVTNPNPLNPGQNIVAGDTTGRTRVADVDHDGRLDIVSFSAPNTVPKVFFNVGGQFSTPGQLYPGDVKGITRKAISAQNFDPYESLSWRLNADLIDLDGDGIQEGISFGTTGMERALPAETQPPRLLSAVHNGRGAHSTITYGHMHDDTVVEQHPELEWLDGRPKSSPRAQWVVKSIQDVDELAQTEGTTAYFYKNPRYGADDEGRYSFRGFKEVTTTAPGPTGLADGARTVQRYGYEVDWSGRLVTTVVMPSETEGVNEVRRISETTWQPYTLFSDAIITFHPAVTKQRVCSNGQDEAACLAAPAGYTQTTSSLTAYPITPAANDEQLWAESGSLLQAGTAAANGDRETLTTYQLDSNASLYLFHPFETTSRHRVSGAMVTFARSRSTWDPTLGSKITDEVWVDGVDANRAITRYWHDPSTGNLLWTWKPEQWALDPNPLTNLVRTSITYDGRQLFPATEVNELGHLRKFWFEYGTGTKLATLGPNAAPCASSSCPAGTPLEEESMIRIDGLGRVIERFETRGNDESHYTLHKLETNTYYDGPVSATTPLSITHQTAVDYNPVSQTVRYTQDKTELDGHGRPMRTIIPAQGAAAADQITSYKYGHDGTLAEVRVPDPAANNSSTVTYAYTYDSLGRPLTIRRPDALAPLDRSGVDITYNGLSQTSTEVVGAALGNAASTTTLSDSYGRLVQVDEKRSATESSTTTYSYGPDDSVETIVDPEGVTTQLVHDFAGRRTQIKRNTRTWSYDYDRNGNMISETTPCTGTGCSAAHMTSIVYDELDRPTSKALAPRTLTQDDLALFGATSEIFEWDNGANGKGRMSKWQSFGPSGAAVTTLAPTYNVAGQQVITSQTTNAADYTNLSRWFGRRYHISGAVAEAHFQDVVGTQTCAYGSIAAFYYDNRGLPYQTQIVNCADAFTPDSFVRNARNVAGLVTKRYSVANTGPFTYVESNWNYDKLGRVASQEINKGGSLAQVARQELEYFGNDDPKTMDHWLGETNHKQFEFGYDHRHQLTDVAEHALPDAFTATYTYDHAGRFASATEDAAALPDGDVVPRDVVYVYSATDPEQLVRLRKTPGNKNLAEYTWDAGGNQLTRYYPDSKKRWEYVYDGKNQLRRATKTVDGIVEGSEEYWYDDKNVRYLVVKRDASGAKTGALWFIEDTEAHYDAMGTVTRAFGHVSMGTPVARLDRNSDGAAKLEYQFHGLANNTLATVEQSTGVINASFVYAPFGEVIEAKNDGGATNGLTFHRRRMNDKFVDEISGLAYYGYRYYDKLSMTWTQGDPLYRFAPDASWNEPRRASLHTFTGNNPLRFLDPDGQDWKEYAVGMAVGALDFASFGQYSEKMLPSLVSDEGMEYANSSADFNEGRRSSEAVLSAYAVVTGAAALRGGVKVAGTLLGSSGAAAAVSSVGAVEATYAAFAVAAAGSSIARVGGETAATARGRQAHKDWDPGKGFQKEFTLESGKRADAVNKKTKTVLELKPDNAKAIKRGLKQVEAYAKELGEMFGGKWKGKVVTYKASKASKAPKPAKKPTKQ